MTDRVLADLLEIRALAGQVYRPDGVEIWLHARNGALGGQRPAALIREGHTEIVRTVLEGLIR